MLTAFTIWRSKTDVSYEVSPPLATRPNQSLQSLPALKFHSRHLKEKFFKRWRMAMPNALRMKKARETDRYNTLGKNIIPHN